MSWGRRTSPKAGRRRVRVKSTKQEWPKRPRAGGRCTRQPRGVARPDGSSGRSRVRRAPAEGLTPRPPEKFARPRNACSAARHLLVAATAELGDGAERRRARVRAPSARGQVSPVPLQQASVLTAQPRHLALQLLDAPPPLRQQLLLRRDDPGQLLQVLGRRARGLGGARHGPRGGWPRLRRAGSGAAAAQPWLRGGDRGAARRGAAAGLGPGGAAARGWRGSASAPASASGCPVPRHLPLPRAAATPLPAAPPTRRGRQGAELRPSRAGEEFAKCRLRREREREPGDRRGRRRL